MERNNRKNGKSVKVTENRNLGLKTPAEIARKERGRAPAPHWSRPEQPGRRRALTEFPEKTSGDPTRAAGPARPWAAVPAAGSKRGDECHPEGDWLWAEDSAPSALTSEHDGSGKVSPDVDPKLPPTDHVQPFQGLL